jgi:hypothetical protein
MILESVLPIVPNAYLGEYASAYVGGQLRLTNKARDFDGQPLLNV